MNSPDNHISSGTPFPLGASVRDGGINFTLFSRHAESIRLLLFKNPNDEAAFLEITLDPAVHRTGDIWHVFVEAAGPGTLYLYSIDGPNNSAAGHRYDPAIPLLDPYTLSTIKDRRGQRKCVVPDCRFDWEGDRPPRVPMEQTIIYETHIRGFTVHPSSGVPHPGTYKGFIEKIPYLQNLGITAVELLPIQEYDDGIIHPRVPIRNGKLVNYWGYSTVAFFAPHRAYASSSVPGGEIAEFKEMVRELHKAGIEVIMDVVFNHTAEGGEGGETFSFRGIDNRIYYMLHLETGAYLDYTGCKNTFNCSHPVVQDLIMDCLRYWVLEMHIDGFRFDLASVFSRDSRGNLIDNPPLTERISEDPVLKNIKLIAEAWDAAGAYQVGRFPGKRWSEWNDKYRDDIRKFWLKDSTLTGAYATRVSGSSDLYRTSGRYPYHSINYITSHDGFTLNDLVQYGRKHNEENGEGGKDGNDGEISDNLGMEGPSINPAIEKRRIRLIKSMIASLLISRGTPMILGGDEFRRSQGGNNNAYCQDNETSWYNWYYMKENSEMVEFFRKLIIFRKLSGAFSGRDYYGAGGPWSVHWLDEDAAEIDWITQNGFLAFMTTSTEAPDRMYYILINPSKQDVPCSIVKPPENFGWYRVIDTAVPSPGDVTPEGEEVPVSPYDSYVSKPASVVVLITKRF